jgi:uncharacterized protein HemY
MAESLGADARCWIMAGIGKGLIYLGILLVVVGVALSLIGKVPWLGQLPGDITIERGRFTFYFPLTTCIIISVILSLVLYFFRR